MRWLWRLVLPKPLAFLNPNSLVCLSVSSISFLSRFQVPPGNALPGGSAACSLVALVALVSRFHLEMLSQAALPLVLSLLSLLSFPGSTWKCSPRRLCRLFSRCSRCSRFQLPPGNALPGGSAACSLVALVALVSRFHLEMLSQAALLLVISKGRAFR
jgi:hypothetical protein